jgi:hypothetical protein
MTSMTRRQSDQIPNKTNTGTPLQYYYEQHLTEGILYVDVIPATLTDTIKLTWRKPFDDLDATGDEFALPKYWYKALIDELTIELCKGYSRQATQDMYMAAQKSYNLALQHDPETTVQYFEPEKLDVDGRGYNS